MNFKYKIISLLSFILLVCVLCAQFLWIYQVRETQVDEFYQEANSTLKQVSGRFISEKEKELERSGEMKWEKTETDSLLKQQLVYDYLYKKKEFDITSLDSLYREALQERENFKLLFLQLYDEPAIEQGSSSQQKVGELFTLLSVPLVLGYETPHRLVAVFKIPLFFKAPRTILILEGIFLAGFIFCLLWQWISYLFIRKNDRVQLMGIAHLEHELQKPLSIMISAVGSLISNKNTELSNGNLDKLHMMKARLLKMADTVDTMLTAVKKSRLDLRRTKIDIREELGKISEMFRILKSHAELQVQIEEDVQGPCLDEIYFNYLLINLIDNAIKYGGEHPVVKIHCWQEGNNFMLSVEDNGIGIPQKERKRIFRYFYRSKDRRVARTTGFGLGLSFVRKVVAAYDGRIEVESVLGQGSKFIVVLPQ